MLDILRDNYKKEWIYNNKEHISNLYGIFLFTIDKYEKEYKRLRMEDISIDEFSNFLYSTLRDGYV